MSTGLHLTSDEFDRMVECGAFDHLNRGEKLSPLAAKDAVLDLDDLFAVE